MESTVIGFVNWASAVLSNQAGLMNRENMNSMRLKLAF